MFRNWETNCNDVMTLINDCETIVKHYDDSLPRFLTIFDVLPRILTTFHNKKRIITIILPLLTKCEVIVKQCSKDLARFVESCHDLWQFSTEEKRITTMILRLLAIVKQCCKDLAPIKVGFPVGYIVGMRYLGVIKRELTVLNSATVLKIKPLGLFCRLAR